MFRRLCLVYLLTFVVVFVLALGYSLRISPTYTVDALLIPKDQSNSTQLSGIASATKLLGLTSGGDQSSNFAKFQKYWGSRDIANNLQKKYPFLLRQIFAGDWDKANNRWYDHPHTLRQIVAIPLNWLFGVYPSYAPSSQDFADYIKNSMKVDTDQLGQEIHITFNSSDAVFAHWFLGAVIAQTDAAVRDAEQKRDLDFVKFSRDRLASETNVGYRDALTNSLRQFEIASMYSEAGDNFSFQYVDAPSLPVDHSAPRPLFYTVLAFVFANLLALCVIAALFLWPQSWFSSIVDGVLDRMSSGGSKARPRHDPIDRNNPAERRVT